ncbi:ATP-binding cassette domain-containing protein [Streptomyces sp. NPDC007905]|uniref:ATP-binding cassette domain-containing protein n=1 Tax=Streptomyces sp. NPDC007905 TaxID=3364788 RepID=UPI0036EBC4F4
MSARTRALRLLRGRGRALLRLGLWSVLEAGQTFLAGYALARALDAGFLAGDARTGLLWLGAAGLAVGAGAYGTGRVYGVVAALVEPVRDRLVATVVRRGVREADAGALSGLTQQVEIARDTLAGLVMVSRSFLFTAAGALIGLCSLAPLLLTVVVPPLLAGVCLFTATLRPLARRQEAFLTADEALAEDLGAVCPGLRDVTAAGAGAQVAASTGRLIEAEQRAARALARWSVTRVAALAVGGELPVVLLLATAPWLLGHGVSPGALVGALAYVTQSLLPALHNLVHGLGTSGSRLTVVLRRLTPATGPGAPRPADRPGPPGTRETGSPHEQPKRDDSPEPHFPRVPRGAPDTREHRVPHGVFDAHEQQMLHGVFDTHEQRPHGAPHAHQQRVPHSAPHAHEQPLPHGAPGAHEQPLPHGAPDAHEQRPHDVPDTPEQRLPDGAPGAHEQPLPHGVSNAPLVPDHPTGPHDSPEPHDSPGPHHPPEAPTPATGAPPPVAGTLPVASTTPDTTTPPLTSTPALALTSVTFAYGPASEPVLDGLDLTVPAGGHLAVVGPSGIGKSTLTGLVAGLLEPREGVIRVYGHTVPGPAAATLRVLIPQEAYVHGGTLAENLGLFRQDPVPEAELLAAAEALGLTPLARALGGPAGRVDPAALSAGERQLIALTRAYLSPAPLALLDEATCHLDPEAEARAERAFAARPGGTLVVVAHRISSARRAGRVLVMDGPRTACGTHDELLRTSALYRDLVGGWTMAPTTPVG